MKKLLLLLSIVFITINSFGQATGYVLPNFPTSGSIGLATATVDVYSRININQTTPSITLTVPTPTNTSTKVVEVWIANKGAVSFNLIPLPDTSSFALDTGKFVILKWIGARYAISGGGSSPVDLSGYIKRDGTSDSTTGTIKIGDGYGFQDTSSAYNSRSVTAGIEFFKSDPFYFGNRPLRISAGSTDYRSTFSVADDGYIFNTVNNFSGNTAYSYISGNGFYVQNYTSGFSGSYLGLSTSGLSLQAQAGSGVTRSALIRTSLYTGSGSYVYELPNKAGTFAMTSDIPTSFGTGAIVVSSNITAKNDSTYHVVATATFTDPSPVEGLGYTVVVRNGTATVGGSAYAIAGVAIKRIFHSGAWANYTYGTSFLSGTGGVSYNNITGSISFNLATGNTWTTQQTAPSWYASGTGGLGYVQIASQSSAPAAVNGSMIIYSDASNRFSLVRRNAANSADITRTHIYPDASYSWTFPTPASGTTSTLAGLETAQTFTANQTFSGTTNRFVDARPDLTNARNLGATNAIWNNAFINNIYSTLTLTAAASISSSSSISRETGNQTGTSASSISGNITDFTGNVTSASAVSTQASGSYMFEAGTAAGSAKRGNWQMFGGFTLQNFQSGERIGYIGNRTTAPTGNPSSGFFMYGNSGNATIWSSGGGVTTIGTAGVVMETAGQGLQFKTGTNARVGTSTLASGTITVANTSVTANTKVKVQLVSVNGGTLGIHYLYTINAGVGFTITAVDATGATVTTDNAIVDWYLTEFN